MSNDNQPKNSVSEGKKPSRKELPCRDYIWGICNKGATNCKFNHILDIESMKDVLKFCHDYQNRTGCTRHDCTYLHVSREEETLFLTANILPDEMRLRYENMEMAEQMLGKASTQLSPPPPPPPPPAPLAPQRVLRAHPPPPPPPQVLTAAPVRMPAAAPVRMPAAAPVRMPAAAPVIMPAAAPVMMPAAAPVRMPAAAPVMMPAAAPVMTPAAAPVRMPAAAPVRMPAAAPVRMPAAAPVRMPAAAPVMMPAAAPRFNTPAILPGSQPLLPQVPTYDAYMPPPSNPIPCGVKRPGGLLEAEQNGVPAEKALKEAYPQVVEPACNKCVEQELRLEALAKLVEERQLIAQFLKAVFVLKATELLGGRDILNRYLGGI